MLSFRASIGKGNIPFLLSHNELSFVVMLKFNGLVKNEVGCGKSLSHRASAQSSP